MTRQLALFFTLLLLRFTLSAQSLVEFPSVDKLMLTADLYEAGPNTPVVLLCHQAGYSRGEYRFVAPVLQKGGFTCLALDARSGNEVNGIKNETAARAKVQRKPTEYLDAEQDIVAAINWLHQRYHRPIILVGSSYSAGLVMKIAHHDERISAVAAFSPGEYYGKGLNLTASINGLRKPVFVASSKSESDDVAVLMKVVATPGKVQYIPTVEGNHGSKALWVENEGSQGYRDAFWKWLSGLK